MNDYRLGIILEVAFYLEFVVFIILAYIRADAVNDFSDGVFEMRNTSLLFSPCTMNQIRSRSSFRITSRTSLIHLFIIEMECLSTYTTV